MKKFILITIPILLVILFIKAAPILQLLYLRSFSDTIRDIEFATVDETSLKLDIYLPRFQLSSAPVPAIIAFHGGGWEAGEKADMEFVALELVGSGFAVISPSYRLSTTAPFPAQIHDAKAAVRWVRANATNYNLDTNDIGVIGLSAGGQIATMLAVSNNDAALEGNIGGNLEQSSKISAAVNGFGPMNLNTITEQCKPSDSPECVYLKRANHKYVGCDKKAPKKCAELLAYASPQSHISADDPPILAYHGDKDPIVPLVNSIEFDKAYKAMGLQSEIIVMQNTGHRLNTNLRKAIDFYNLHLNKPHTDSGTSPE